MRTVAVKEHGLIFSAPLITRLLDGSKTQTRRIVKQGRNEVGEPADAVCYCSDGTWISWWGKEPKEGWQAVTDFRYPNGGGFKCPYQVGDLIWVRETWSVHECYDPLSPREVPSIDHDAPEHPIAQRTWYGGDCRRVNGSHSRGDSGFAGKERPSIHMPRWASRITLEITSVRVERLNQITAADAWAEGIRPEGVSEIAGDGTLDDVPPDAATIEGFRDLWNKINGKGSWERNDYVWIIEFKRVLDEA